MIPSRLTFSAAAARAAIDDDDDEEEPGEVIESAPPLKVGEERPIHASGITKKLLKSGFGWQTPVFGDEATVHCVETVVDGPKFDSSRDQREPVTIKLGEGQTGRGLDEGIITMKKGECALFTLPASSDYADKDARGALPGSVIQYEVELISWISVVDVCRDGGIVKRVLSRGNGAQPSDLDEVTVRFQAKLSDGSIVEQTSEEGIEFSINNGFFCPALPKVVKTMEKGEQASVSVQPNYAFGFLGKDSVNGLASIPPNSALTIDLELMSFKSVIDVTGDAKVLKKILKAGEGIRTPKEGDPVRIKYKGMLEDGTVFESFWFNGGGVFEFVIDEEQVVPGLDRAAATMVKGEISVLTVKPEYGYGSNEVKRDLAIVPACSTLIYEVEMLDFTQEKELWEMNTSEKLEVASKLKEHGNDLFKAGKHQRATKKYDKAIQYVHDDASFHNEEQTLAKALRVSCWLNGAACSLKLNDYHNAIKLCSKVLDVEFHNVKALYRRAQAYMEISDLELSELDVRNALEVDPQSRELKSLQKTLKQLQSESNKRDAKFCSNMFARMGKEEELSRKKRKVEDDDDMERQSEPPPVEIDSVSASTDLSVDAMVVDFSGHKSTII